MIDKTKSIERKVKTKSIKSKGKINKKVKVKSIKSKGKINKK